MQGQSEKVEQLSQTSSQCKEEELISELLDQKIDLNELLFLLIKHMRNPKEGIRISDFFKVFALLNCTLSNQDKISMFNVLDQTQNGSIDIEEIINFYLRINSKAKKDFQIVFMAMAKQLVANQANPEHLLSLLGIQGDFALSAQKFVEISYKMLYIKEEKFALELFAMLDTTNNGQIQAQILIDKLNKEMLSVPDIKQQEKVEEQIQENQSKQQQLELILGGNTKQAKKKDLDEEKKTGQQALKNVLSAPFNQEKQDELLNKLKQQLQSSDFFIRNNKSDQSWQTILNSELACLKKCNELVKELKEKDLNQWTDYEFGPQETDPYGAESLFFDPENSPSTLPQKEEFEWLRPEQILNLLATNEKQTQYAGVTADFFDDQGSNLDDAVQSKYLGDCWFISALTLIAPQPKLIIGSYPNKFGSQDIQDSQNELTEEESLGVSQGVYPPIFHYLRRYKIYVFRFFKQFQWRYVIIDDRLPCKNNGQMIFSSCRNKAELWVALIEKAFAKLHNCYEAIQSGDISQGLTDLTGLNSRRLRLDQLRVDNKKEELWQLLLNSKKQGLMMGCSAEGQNTGNIFYGGDNTGLLSFHGYAITDVFELPDNDCENSHKSHRLLRIRNPWGCGEWMMKWSECNDPKYNAFIGRIKEYYDNEIKQAKLTNSALNIEPYKDNENDGTFLMCFKDWRNIFSFLFICIKVQNEWNGLQIIDQWDQNQSGGAPKASEDSKIQFALKNPQFRLDINRKQENQKSSFQIFLSQQDGRLTRGSKFPYESIINPIMFCVFKLDEGQDRLNKFDKNKMVGSTGLLNTRRDIDIELNNLQNGSYILIPFTKQEGQFGPFSLTLFYNCFKEELRISKVIKYDYITEKDYIERQKQKDLRELKMNNCISTKIIK